MQATTAQGGRETNQENKTDRTMESFASSSSPDSAGNLTPQKYRFCHSWAVYSPLSGSSIIMRRKKKATEVRGTPLAKP